MPGHALAQMANDNAVFLNLKVTEVLESVNDAVIVTDQKHRIIVFNERAEDLFGLKAEEALGKLPLDTIVPASMAAKYRSVTRLVEEGSPACGEATLKRQDGKKTAIRYSVKPICNGSHEKVGHLAILIDISELKRREDRLRDRLRELRTFQNVARALARPLPTREVMQRAIQVITEVIGADAGVIFVVKKGGTVFYPFAHQDVPGKVIQELTPHALKGSFTGDILNSRTGRVIHDLRTRSKNSGYVLPAVADAGFRSLIGVPLRNKKNVLGTLEVASRAANRLGGQDLRFLLMLGGQIAGAIENAALREELEKNLSSKNRLLKEARHRLTNNLQAITSFLLTSVECEHCGANWENVTESLVQRISGIAAVQEQMDRDTGEEMSLSETMSRLEICLLEMYDGRLDFDFSFEDGERKVPMSTARSLGIAVNELVWNACTHAFSPEEKGHVGISLETADGVVRVRVVDNGRGIPEDFDLVRDSNTGLSIVRNLVERDLGGEFTLRKEQGTVATLTWPIS